MQPHSHHVTIIRSIWHHVSWTSGNLIFILSVTLHLWWYKNIILQRLNESPCYCLYRNAKQSSPFISLIQSCLPNKQKWFENPFSPVIDVCPCRAEWGPPSLSRTTEPTLQALSLCLFLSNSHSLFTFAFLHCDSRQNDRTPDPLGTDCQASLFKAVMKTTMCRSPPLMYRPVDFHIIFSYFPHITITHQ